QRLGLAIDEFTNRNVAFGNPGTFVEQPRRREKRREVDFYRLRTELRELCTRAFEKLLRILVAEEFELRGARHADPAPGDRRRRRGCTLASRIRIARIEPRDDIQHRRRV